MELTQDLIADNNNKLRKMKIATLVLIGTLFASSMAMSLTSKSDQFEEFMPQEDFKTWAIDFGHGFVDGVTFNFTANGTAPQCRTGIEAVGTIIDEIKGLYEAIKDGTFNTLEVITFLSKVQTTITSIASDCHFLELYTSIVGLFNPFALILKFLSLLIFKIPSLVVTEYEFFKGLFTLNGYLMGLATGRNLSIITGWEIY